MHGGRIVCPKWAGLWEVIGGGDLAEDPSVRSILWQMGLPGSLAVWTPSGMASVLLPESQVIAHPTAQLLRARITRARQLAPDRIVGLAGEGIRNVLGPPSADRLVIFSPSTPDDVIDLGDATSWFPSFDGAGLWRVRQTSGGAPLGMWPKGTYEATPFLLDGQQRGPMVSLPEGRCPVAATADGLAVQQEVPRGRPYPAHVGNGPRTEIGGAIVDVVHYDPRTGEIGTSISDYTRVLRAEPRGLALVTNGDPNVLVRPTEFIDLASGTSVSIDQRPELSWWVFPQPRTTSRGQVRTAHLLGRRALIARPLSGNEQADIQLTAELVPATHGRTLHWDQDFAWFDDLLLFAEETVAGVTLALWSPDSRETTRLPAVLPTGSYPLGGSS